MLFFSLVLLAVLGAVSGEAWDMSSTLGQARAHPRRAIATVDHVKSVYDMDDVAHGLGVPMSERRKIERYASTRPAMMHWWRKKAKHLLKYVGVVPPAEGGPRQVGIFVHHRNLVSSMLKRTHHNAVADAHRKTVEQLRRASALKQQVRMKDPMPGPDERVPLGRSMKEAPRVDRHDPLPNPGALEGSLPTSGPLVAGWRDDVLDNDEAESAVPE